MDGLNIILFSFLPAILYILVIFFTVPHKTINIKTAFAHFFIGLMSVGLLKYFWLAFPEWHTIAATLSGVYPTSDPFTYYHYFYFIQVGFIEELAKLAVFLILFNMRKSNGKGVSDHPVALMFYVGAVSLGFAAIENIQYGIMHGEDVLKWRAITSVIGHMVFGLFMGYWIALGRIGTRLYDRSPFDIIINKRKKLRRIIFILIGLFTASIVHGLYDLHLVMNNASGITMIYFYLGVSLLGVYWCFRNLMKRHKEKQEELRGS